MQKTFTLTSSSLGGQATEREEFDGFGCSGRNLSPAISWTGAPAGTKSFAITLYDPDAPTGSGFWHWLLLDIPSTTSGLAEGAASPASLALPAGAWHGKSDYGVAAYGGPCPPPGHGPHAYQLTVHALSVEKLGVPADSSAAVIGFNLNAHTLAKATLVFYHTR